MQSCLWMTWTDLLSAAPQLASPVSLVLFLAIACGQTKMADTSLAWWRTIILYGSRSLKRVSCWLNWSLLWKPWNLRSLERRYAAGLQAWLGMAVLWLCFQEKIEKCDWVGFQKEIWGGGLVSPLKVECVNEVRDRRFWDQERRDYMSAPL